MDGQRSTSDRSSGLRIDLGIAYGLVAGAALGTLLLALTGDSAWIAVGPGIGLLVGIAVAGLLADHGEADPPTDDDGVRR